MNIVPFLIQGKFCILLSPLPSWFGRVDINLINNSNQGLLTSQGQDQFLLQGLECSCGNKIFLMFNYPFFPPTCMAKFGLKGKKKKSPFPLSKLWI